VASHRRYQHVASAGMFPTRVVACVLAIVALMVVAGAAWLWPRHRIHTPQSSTIVTAVVRTVALAGCDASGASCVRQVDLALISGPDAGRNTTLTFTPGPTDPGLVVGETVRLARAAQGGQVVYQFADIARGRPLVLLAVLFVIVVVAVGRLRGVAALVGLVFAGAVLVIFVLPALLDGASPTLVALIAGAAITLVVLPLSHGLSTSTAVAVLGTLAGMLVAAVVAAVAEAALRFTGLSGEENATLALLGSRSTVSGLLLAGAVIGALGVLNDVTVTQVAAVAELAPHAASRRAVFASTMRIGRDHIASTVYSLVLAYAGSALPVLLLFSLSRESTTDVLSSDAVAPEIAASLIGGIALVVVVPLTTALAAALAPMGDGVTG
jgi:uncharacterized membrane protein